MKQTPPNSQLQCQKPLGSLCGSCPTSQTLAEGVLEPLAHFSLRTSAWRPPSQAGDNHRRSQCIFFFFFFLQCMFLIVPEWLLPYSSLPSQSFLYGLQINVPQTQTSLHSFLPWLRNLHGSSLSRLAFSAHDLSHAHTHTHTHPSKADSCSFLFPNFPLAFCHLLSSDPTFRPLPPGPLSLPSPFHSLNNDFPYGLHKAPLMQGRGLLTPGEAVGKAGSSGGAAWCLECPED